MNHTWQRQSSYGQAPSSRGGKVVWMIPGGLKDINPKGNGVPCQVPKSDKSYPVHACCKKGWSTVYVLELRQSASGGPEYLTGRGCLHNSSPLRFAAHFVLRTSELRDQAQARHEDLKWLQCHLRPRIGAKFQHSGCPSKLSSVRQRCQSLYHMVIRGQDQTFVSISLPIVRLSIKQATVVAPSFWASDGALTTVLVESSSAAFKRSRSSCSRGIVISDRRMILHPSKTFVSCLTPAALALPLS
jgi:hypothetical protein